MGIFGLFKIGIGPSSSHTVGPMIIAKKFCETLKELNYLEKVTRVKVELYGSLGLTGMGHSSDVAILLGLLGKEPKTVETKNIQNYIKKIKETSQLMLLNEKNIFFSIQEDLIFNRKRFLAFHPNGIKLSSFNKDKEVFSKSYYSIGGGEVLSDDEINKKSEKTKQINIPYCFSSAKELINLCEKNNMSIWEIMLENEKMYKDKDLIEKQLWEIWEVMKECVQNGLMSKGVLPGGLNVPKRANKTYEKLKKKKQKEPLDFIDWINLYAMAVNEENASGNKVVTAPTNGAAGIIPAVLHYIVNFLLKDKSKEKDVAIKFLLTSGAIGLLYQKNASISGADVGCQGEVGVACSMAAAGIADFLKASPKETENAAEIAMEHNLGLTCDPIGGLVQIPCIERNALAAVKAVNAAKMAINTEGEHYVSLDCVIETMYNTGKDMRNKYKETSRGGLAVYYAKC